MKKYSVSLNGVVISATPILSDHNIQFIIVDKEFGDFIRTIRCGSNEIETLIVVSDKLTVTYRINELDISRDEAYFKIVSRSIEQTEQVVSKHYSYSTYDFLTKGEQGLSPDEVLQELNALRDAVIEAHRIILHEMDNGRTPTMLKGIGLGYFEDLIK